MQVFINPGTGPVDGATKVDASANMAQLLIDAHIQTQYDRAPEHDENDGRFAFVVRHNNRACVVNMPGLPLEQVRYLGAEGQNIWHYPRLYVDGSSWVWKYAVESLNHVLTCEDDG